MTTLGIVGSEPDWLLGHEETMAAMLSSTVEKQRSIISCQRIAQIDLARTKRVPPLKGVQYLAIEDHQGGSEGVHHGDEGRELDSSIVDSKAKEDEDCNSKIFTQDSLGRTRERLGRALGMSGSGFEGLLRREMVRVPFFRCH
jgi:hypothetical protein